MKKQNVILSKSYDFAVKIVKLYQHLSKEQKEFVLSKQLLKCGTSIGANVEEGVGGYSKKDFSAKFGIAYKESRETKYWLRILRDTGYLSNKKFEILFATCDELSKLLFSILKNSR
ncbi:MAG: four helix bundle protein [Fulvivirga sp.]|nr:four helix bundle protein [Fulvivirga sp.]